MRVGSLKSELTKYLKSQHLITLATFDKKAWVCTVYFVTDSDLNFYFVSSPKSKHCKDIDRNNKVAIAVYDSHIKNSDKKAGMQLQGRASQIKNWKKTEKILKMWNKKNPGMEKVISVEKMKKGEVSSRVYQVKPTYIKYFNQLLGEDGVKEFKL